MAEVTDVDITNGVPDGGTGTVPTLSKTNTVIGAVNETAPASDTASSGLNGRLQRVAQRLTSLIALIPAALTAGGGIKVGVVDALPAGTNAIGKLASNSGVNIGTVTIDTTQVAGPAVSASATFTPAASSHTAGDCNGAAQEFALSAPSAGRIMITSASLEIDGGTAEATAWRLFLFNVTPPSAVADDSPHTLPSGDRSAFLGFIDLGTAVDQGDTQWIETHGINKQIKLAGTSVFGYLVNLTTLTPANVAHIVTLHAVPL